VSWLRPADADRQLLDYVAERQPEVLTLARRLAPALRIEPRLLRNGRLALLPESDAGLEAALWQSPLVASSSARGLTLKPGIARLLTNELAQQQEDYDASLRLIESNTAHWHPRERIEQSMRLDVPGLQADPEALRQKLRQVLRELIKTSEPRERQELARWAKGALPQLIDNEQALEEAAWLAQFTAATLGDSGALVQRQCQHGTPLPDWLATVAATESQSHKVGLRWRPGVLECLADGEGPHSLELTTPLPAPVFLRCGEGDAGRWELFWPQRRIPLPVDCSGLLLQPLAGKAMRLERRRSETPQTGEAEPWPESQRVILSYVEPDYDQAHAIAKLLHSAGIGIELAQEPDLLQTYSETPGSGRVIRLWTKAAASFWSDSSADHHVVAPNGLLLRTEAVDFPEGEIGMGSISMLDWIDWKRSAASPEALQEFVDKLRQWLKTGPGNGQEKRDDREPGEDVEPLSREAYLAVSKVRLRLGPGIEYDIHPASPLQKGTLVVGLRHSGEWIQVESDSLGIGRKSVGHIFLSYAREDRERVAVIASALTAKGWKVWWDRDNLHPGESFRREIDKAIKAASCVVVFWSEHSVDSDWVIEEANEGKKLNKLLSILLDKGRLPFGFGRIQYADFASWDGDPNHKAFQRILTYLDTYTAKPDAKESTSDRQGWVQIRYLEKIVAAAKEESDRFSDEIESLLAEIDDPKTPPLRRLEIGDELVRLGDPRKGVGLDVDGLPAIDWIEIPAGIFLYGMNRVQRELPTFYMARYPVTHAQYQAFIDAGGYRDKRWWEGLEQKISHPDPPQRREPNRPRDSLNWYEAMAFCRWLSDRLGYEIRLPTEWEWEKAARGTDGREFPWGEDFKEGFANIDQISSYAVAQTMAVGLYPHAASPYGVEDLSGNVWEWCLNEYDVPRRIEAGGDKDQVLRGGSWMDKWWDGRAYRSLRTGPINPIRSIGFRVACSSLIPR
jgi:formylglycine-generating enzyme required for sulfatase activity